MDKLLIDLQYLPPVAYFAALSQAGEVWIEAHEHFVKQTYRNRCSILSAQKVQHLSVPIRHTGRKIAVRQLGIDYHQKWVNDHWRSIESAYRKAPFFDYYGEAIRDILYSEPATLFELNLSLLTICLEYLQIDITFSLTTRYRKIPETGIIDLRSGIHPKKSLADLLWFHPKPYPQIFGKDFVPNLSILDLLFCQGTTAIEVLKKSIVTRVNK